MSGHSKWSTIKRKKEKTDQQRAKIFTKIGRELAVAVREGGSADPNANTKLYDVIQKAKQNNVPNDNIDRIIKKAAGEGDSSSYEEAAYEGYGPSGVAVIVKALTDNKNRTAADLRHYFDKYGAGLGTQGCVSFLFTDTGMIVILKGNIDEDKLMEDALEAGATDFQASDEAFEISTDPADLRAVTEALTQKGYAIESSEQDKIPATTVTITAPELFIKMEKLIEMLEDNDDVQEIFHNWDVPEEE